MVWSDEFDSGDSPNSENWIFDIGTGVEIFGQPGWGNNELQYYTDRPENIKVENGMLEITTRKEFFEGSQYTSAKILTELNLSVHTADMKREFNYHLDKEFGRLFGY